MRHIPRGQVLPQKESCAGAQVTHHLMVELMASCEETMNLDPSFNVDCTPLDSLSRLLFAQQLPN